MSGVCLSVALRKIESISVDCRELKMAQPIDYRFHLFFSKFIFSQFDNLQFFLSFSAPSTVELNDFAI